MDIVKDKEETINVETRGGSETIAQEETPQISSSRLSRRAAALAVMGLAVVYIVSIIYSPSDPADGQYFTICGFKNLTGLPCPGCGLTHSFCAIGKGDMGSAFAYNFLGPPLFLFSILIWIRSISALTGFEKFASAFDRVAARWKPARVFLIAFVLFGAGRIIYLSIYQPSYFSGSPLAQLIEMLAR